MIDGGLNWALAEVTAIINNRNEILANERIILNFDLCFWMLELLLLLMIIMLLLTFSRVVDSNKYN